MNRRTIWKLRHWIIAGYAIPVFALIVSAGTAIFHVNQLKQKAHELEQSSQIDNLLGRIDINVQLLSKATRGYLLDPNPEFLETLKDAKAEYEKGVEGLKQLISGREQQQQLDQISQLVDELEVTNQKLIDLVKQGKTKQAIASWKREGGEAQSSKITQLLQELEAQVGRLVLEDGQLQAEALNNLQTVVLLATGLSVFLSVVVGLWIIAKASRQINLSASVIASSASQIAASTEEQERTTNQQAASVNETTATMDQLGTSSRQSAEQAEAAAMGAKQALDLTNSGAKAVGRTMEGMTMLRDKMGAIADQILRLSEQTNQIGSISGLVSDLANQTNMLALNAAVEAVRAGEHGKGFGVVSSEIRKLADQSKRSAEKINILVADIQTAINSTVMATDEGTKTVEAGVKIAEETDLAFAGVANAVNNVVLNNQQISLNIQQQAAAVQQVVGAMNSLNAAAKESASGISQIKVGTQQLNNAAQDLQAVV